jgi:hypothetical protein
MPTLFLESIVFIVMKIIITEEQLNTIINHNDKMIQAIKSLIDDIEMEGVCDVKIYSEDDESEDEMYSVYLVINPEWYLTVNKLDKSNKNISINKTKKTINDKLKLYLNLNVYVGSYVNPDNC